MASINQVCDVIARTTGEDIMRVRAVARTLINNDQLPKSRGRSIPTANPIHVARLLLGIYVSNVPATAAPAVVKYSNLRDQGSKAPTAKSKAKRSVDETECDCLLGLAGEIYKAYEDRLEYIEICLSWPEVLFKFKKGGQNRFLEPWVDPDYRQIDRPKKVVIIPGKIIKSISDQLLFDAGDAFDLSEQPAE